MKKSVLLLFSMLVLIIIVVACNNETTEPQNSSYPSDEPTATPTATTSSQPEVIEDPYTVNLVECQFYGDSMQNLEYKEAWPRIVEEHYGVPITMVLPERNGYMETIQMSAMSGDLTGIVELFGGTYLAEWKAEGLIYPLTDFLADNETWNTIIPDYWKDAFTIDGEVWAIPTGSDGAAAWLARSMRGDWLEKFGMSKPYTIDEFYEASYKFTYNDPNETHTDDTVGFTANGIHSLQDIFSAFDARLNHLGEAKIAWNPNTGIWEDSMIKPEMVDCLEFLKKCYSNGVLDNECFDGILGSELRDKVASGFYGGTRYWDAWTLSFETNLKKFIPEAYMVSVGALSNTIDKNLNHYGVGVGVPKVLMKTTPQPKETINWYVNAFFGDDWGFWTGRLGPVGEFKGQENRACTIEDNTIVRNTYIDDNGAIKTFPGPGFIGGLPSKALYTVYEVEYYVPSPPAGFENWAEDTAKKAMDNTARRNAWKNEYIENGMLYMLPSFLTEPTYSKYDGMSSGLNKIGETAIINAIKGAVSIETALAEYKEYAKTIGLKAVLDFENEKIGKTTTQDYD